MNQIERLNKILDTNNYLDFTNTNLTIFSNVINVTGRATSNYYALVSGMELEDTYAEVYNNTINVVNDLAYSSSNNIYGISYYQTTSGNHTFNISDNIVRTNGHYAVYLADVTKAIKIAGATRSSKQVL